MNYPIRLLLIEDNPTDIDMFRNSLEHSSGYEIQVFESIDVARKYNDTLNDDWAKAADIIFLSECHNPMASIDFLKALRSSSRFSRTPIIVLGYQGSDAQIYDVYDSLANCYIDKPNTPEEYINLVQVMERYWLRVVKLPPRVDHL